MQCIRWNGLRFPLLLGQAHEATHKLEDAQRKAEIAREEEEGRKTKRSEWEWGEGGFRNDGSREALRRREGWRRHRDACERLGALGWLGRCGAVDVRICMRRRRLASKLCVYYSFVRQYVCDAVCSSKMMQRCVK
ncbi:hypothetical protein CYLTODRAFT_119211 [Cylindrobasidium torrendii FP15055 ss-10]|uniref:Uncharacterized protein n=1 Tax=Cylindrobasidium torrendii FP15055 ss-10 TaxID=1314674 RepID=A0A0D7B344_9AGAR|nr:hypothetical protein CYLTODRAFT_119211 [Cylindrobasidium torrendii FP15055 ss-10]